MAIFLFPSSFSAKARLPFYLYDTKDQDQKVLKVLVQDSQIDEKNSRKRRRNLRVRRGKWLPLRGKIIPVYNTPVLQSKRMRDRWNCR